MGIPEIVQNAIQSTAVSTEKQTSPTSAHSGSSWNEEPPHKRQKTSDSTHHKENRKKRIRTVFSVKQLTRLEEEFTRKQYVTEKERTALAIELDLPEDPVKIWFRNRRAKQRLENKRKDKEQNSHTNGNNGIQHSEVNQNNNSNHRNFIAGTTPTCIEKSELCTTVDTPYTVNAGEYLPSYNACGTQHNHQPQKSQTLQSNYDCSYYQPSMQTEYQSEFSDDQLYGNQQQHTWQPQPQGEFNTSANQYSPPLQQQQMQTAAADLSYPLHSILSDLPPLVPESLNSECRSQCMQISPSQHSPTYANQYSPPLQQQKMQTNDLELTALNHAIHDGSPLNQMSQQSKTLQSNCDSYTETTDIQNEYQSEVSDDQLYGNQQQYIWQTIQQERNETQASYEKRLRDAFQKIVDVL